MFYNSPISLLAIGFITRAKDIKQRKSSKAHCTVHKIKRFLTKIELSKSKKQSGVKLKNS